MLKNGNMETLEKFRIDQKEFTNIKGGLPDWGVWKVLDLAPIEIDGLLYTRRQYYDWFGLHATTIVVFD